MKPHASAEVAFTLDEAEEINLVYTSLPDDHTLREDLAAQSMAYVRRTTSWGEDHYAALPGATYEVKLEQSDTVREVCEDKLTATGLDKVINWLTGEKKLARRMLDQMDRIAQIGSVD